MAGALVTAVILLAAALAARKQLRKGAWRKSCVGCARCGHTCEYSKSKQG